MLHLILLFCLISVQAERTFERLRYSLGGDRPSGEILFLWRRVLHQHQNDDNFKVIYTRSSDKIDWVKTANDSLKERIKISNISNADIFISIHCNYSADSKEIRGVETWYNPKDNESLNLSKYLQQSLIDLNYTTNRGVRSYVSGEELAVLELNENTSSLIELGFLSNSSDEKFLSSSSGQLNCAKALYSAIIEYKNDTTK